MSEVKLELRAGWGGGGGGGGGGPSLPDSRQKSWRKIARSWARRLGEIVGAGVGIYFLTSEMHKLSGAALWVPAALRDVADILTGAIGAAIFTYIRHRLHKAKHRGGSHGAEIHMASPAVATVATETLTVEKQTRADPAGVAVTTELEYSRTVGPALPAEPHEHGLGRWDRLGHFKQGAVMITACIALIAVYLLIRGACVRSWDARAWLNNERAVANAAATRSAHTNAETSAHGAKTELLPSPHHDSPSAPAHDSEQAHDSTAAHDAAPDAARGSHAAQGASSSAHGEASTNANHGHVPNAMKEVDVDKLVRRVGGGPPEFMDLDRGEILLPLWFTSDQRDYIKAAAERSGGDGINEILMTEPDLLIDWVRAAGVSVGATTVLFLVLHLGIIAFFAAALAYWFETLEAMIHLMH
jgi:hypothetical protein